MTDLESNLLNQYRGNDSLLYYYTLLESACKILESNSLRLSNLLNVNVSLEFSNHEIVVHFHHKLVQIHPFPNGNGRISRLMADIIFQKLEGKTLYWGNTNLVNVSEVRKKYINALRKADAGDYSDLIEFTKETND